MATAMEKLLGAKLLSDKGEVATSSITADVVGIYFSAHWCPPCRGFTPELADFYKQHSKAKNFEIVFASSDRDESSFKGYFGEMPWLALPFSDRALKEKLSKKFKVGGIPTLVFVDAKTGATITTDGRSGVAKGIEEFPYRPKTWGDVLGSDDKVVLKSGEKTTLASSLKGKKYAVFYFSAHWCGPCRQFTPEFAKWYEAHNKDDFEVFFVSADQNLKGFQSYHQEQPWPALEFKSKQGSWIEAMFDVGGYPTVVVADAETGKLVCGDARSRVSSEPEDFPWKEKAVEPLDASLSVINDVPLMALLLDKNSDDATAAAVTAAFEEVAEEVFGGAAAAGASEGKEGDVCADGADDEDDRVRFAVAQKGSSQQVERIREFFGLDGDKAGSIRLFCSVIPQGKKYVWEGKVPTREDIQGFLMNVKNKSDKGKMDLRQKATPAESA